MVSALRARAQASGFSPVTSSSQRRLSSVPWALTAVGPLKASTTAIAAVWRIDAPPST